MKRPWIIALGFAAVIVAAALLRYGTLSPCSAVKQRVKAAIVEQLVTSESDSGFEAVGSMLGFALAGPMIDTMIEGQSPWQCGRVLYRLETGEIDLESLFEKPTE